MALRISGEDHKDPLSRARRFLNCRIREGRRDSIKAGNSIRTVLESNGGRIENETEPLTGSICSSFKITPESGVCFSTPAKRRPAEKRVPRSNCSGFAAVQFSYA